MAIQEIYSAYIHIKINDIFGQPQQINVFDYGTLILLLTNMNTTLIAYMRKLDF